MYILPQLHNTIDDAASGGGFPSFYRFLSVGQEVNAVWMLHVSQRQVFVIFSLKPCI